MARPKEVFPPPGMATSTTTTFFLLILSALTGQVVYISEKVGSSAALDLALAGTVVPGATLAFLQGAAICHAEGAPLQSYLDMVESSIMPGLMLSTFRSSIQMIEKRDYAYTGDGAPLDAGSLKIKVASSIVAFMKEQHVAIQYIPERLIVRDAMPSTPSGKIQKFKLREMLREGLV